MTPDPPFRTLSLFDEPTVPALDGALQWVPVRRRLGVRAFGTNAYRAARAGDEVVEDHDELAVGGWPDRAFEPSEWEERFLDRWESR